MDAANTKYNVRCCSKCHGDVVHVCVSCQCNLCRHCKEKHAKDLLTIDHMVLLYREKFNCISEQEIYVRDPYNVRGTYKRNIFAIRNEALFYRPVLLKDIKTDFRACQSEFSKIQSRLLAFAQKLKNRIDKFEYRHISLIQKIKMNRQLASIQRYLQVYEQSAHMPVQFLVFIKLTHLLPINLSMHISQPSMTSSIDKEYIIKLLGRIQIKEKGKRRVRNERLLKLMPVPKLYQSLMVTGVKGCNHITCVSSDQLWASYNNDLIFTNKSGEILHHHNVLYHGFLNGVHTININGECIYIDINFNIKKMSMDFKTTTNFINMTDSAWKPQCVYWSTSCRELLVGLYGLNPTTGMVALFNLTGHLIKTIQHDNKGLELFKFPIFITENNNLDIVVSDWMRAVVVTERGGRHRFTYTGHPSGSGLSPQGICTDALSHILVCDKDSNSIQILDKDGQFLSHLLTHTACSLSYDSNTHRLWVGSCYRKEIYIYKYITEQKSTTTK